MRREPVVVLALLLALLTSGAALAGARSDDSYRTDIVFLRAMSAERAMALYDRVIGQQGESVVVQGRDEDTLVVKDTPARLARFRALLAALDRGSARGERIFVRPVVYLTPSALTVLVERVFDAEGWPAVVLIPDDRSRQLVVRTTRAHYDTLDALIRRLDQPVPDRGRAIRRL